MLRANLDALGLVGDVQTRDASRFVEGLAAVPGPPVYDLVLCDPPYATATADIAALLVGLVEGGHAAHGAMMVVERARHSEPFDVADDVLDVTDVRTYGDTVLYYVRADTVSRKVGADT